MSDLKVNRTVPLTDEMLKRHGISKLSDRRYAGATGRNPGVKLAVCFQGTKLNRMGDPSTIESGKVLGNGPDDI